MWNVIFISKSARATNTNIKKQVLVRAVDSNSRWRHKIYIVAVLICDRNYELNSLSSFISYRKIIKMNSFEVTMTFHTDSIKTKQYSRWHIVRKSWPTQISCFWGILRCEIVDDYNWNSNRQEITTTKYVMFPLANYFDETFTHLSSADIIPILELDEGGQRIDCFYLNSQRCCFLLFNAWWNVFQKNL